MDYNGEEGLVFRFQNKQYLNLGVATRYKHKCNMFLFWFRNGTWGQ